MTDRVEHLAIEVKLAPGDLGSIAGYASLFGKPADLVNDVIAPGAFSATLAEHKAAGTLPAMLVEHDGDPVGAWLEIVEDELGLRVTGRIDLATEAGRDAYQAVVSGDVDGLSIGFRARKSARSEDGTRTLQEIDLVEISLVRTPAKNTARILAVKSATADASPPAAGAAERKRSDMLEDNAPASQGNEMTALVERIEVLEAKAARPAIVGKAQPEGADLERKALRTLLLEGSGALTPDERKALNIGTAGQGGYFVAPEFSTRVLEKVTEFSPIRSVATVQAIGTQELLIPKIATAVTAGWVAETAARSESEPTVAQVSIKAHEMAVIVPVSAQLLEDSYIDLSSLVSGHIGRQFGKIEGNAFTVGNGTAKPVGLFHTPATTGIATIDKSVATDALWVDALLAMYYGVETAYATNGVWLANRGTIARIRNIKDGQGRLMWTDGLAPGQAPTLLGRPILEVPDAPNLGANAVPLMFGDVREAYTIVDRVGLTLLRDDYTGADNGIVKIRARRRVGGAVVMPDAVKLLKTTAIA